MADAAAWLRWRHPAVRDLAWVLGSPPLLSAPRPAATPNPCWLDADWCNRSLQVSTDWLTRLDADPTPLLAHLAREHDHRLGSRFESLLAFWLAWPDNPAYRLLARNLPIRDAGRTLGELDFLVHDRHAGVLQHWEVAVKFFLGVRPGGATCDWIGPGLRDRLDLKLTRLHTHQLRLCRTVPARAQLSAMGLEAPTPVCLVKGRLFYPAGVNVGTWAPADATPDHLQGWWQNSAGLCTRWQGEGLSWIRLPKANWMTEVMPEAAANMADAALPLNDLLAKLQTEQPSGGTHVANCIIGLDRGREVTRGFVVPKSWPAPTTAPRAARTRLPRSSSR